MLRNTFCHLPGVGPKTEQKFWKDGLRCWDDFLAKAKDKFPGGRAVARRLLVAESKDEFERGNPLYFSDRLPNNQLWRLFPDFRHSCAYLDIETTGLGDFGDHITTIALYDGRRTRCYVHGRNIEDFIEDVREYRLLISYNGAGFDLPFLQREFGMAFPQAHIDLRFLLAGLGLKGGLKNCERVLGLARPGMEDLDGYAAVLLWREFQRTGDEKTLETLLAYNVQDAVVLETLMVEAFNRKVLHTPFADTFSLAEAPAAVNPYRPDQRAVEKVRRQMRWNMSFVT